MCYFDKEESRRREAAFILSTLTSIAFVVGMALASVMLVTGIKRTMQVERACNSDARIFKTFQPTYHAPGDGRGY